MSTGHFQNQGTIFAIPFKNYKYADRGQQNTRDAASNNKCSNHEVAVFLLNILFFLKVNKILCKYQLIISTTRAHIIIFSTNRDPRSS